MQTLRRCGRQCTFLGFCTEAAVIRAADLILTLFLTWRITGLGTDFRNT